MMDCSLFHELGTENILKNWTLDGNAFSRVFIGLANVVYEPLYHTLQLW